ncbi:terminase gpP N-terminus-related DNA-binding protein [Peribacillus sp. JNUCC 23]
MAQTARDLDLNANTIHNWKRKYGEDLSVKAYLPCRKANK